MSRRFDGLVEGDAPVGACDLTVVGDCLGPGYGAATPLGAEAERLMAAREGIRLDGTYTAMTLAGMLAPAGEEPCRGLDLLFWNTFSAVDPAATLAGLPDWRALPPAFRPLLEPAPPGG